MEKREGTTSWLLTTRTLRKTSELRVPKMRTALAIVAFLVSPLLLECATTTCQVGNESEYVKGLCPVKLTADPHHQSAGEDSECVTVRVWMTDDDLRKAPMVTVTIPAREVIRPTHPTMTKKKKNTRKENWVTCAITQQSTHNNTSFPMWELVHHCVQAKVSEIVSVSYSSRSTSCNVSYKVPDLDPIPDFDLSVNQSSKSITITVPPGKEVYARLCYQTNNLLCSGLTDRPVTVDPSQSAQFNIPYLLPCVCVEVYYTHQNARRHKMCPFQKESIADVQDVWLSSEIILYESRLDWCPQCPTSDLPMKISASLCWKQHKHLCTPILNSTLEKTDDGKIVIYNTSSVDKHPQMCVQFSLQDTHNISCPFSAGMSSWEVHFGLSGQHVFLYRTSLDSAMFSAQFCVLNEMGCTPIGPVVAKRMKGNTTKTKINVPPHFLSENPCVQVWQSAPALHGRRILCPEYTHYRCGIYAVAALVFVVIVVLLGLCIHSLTKRGAAGWLYIQKPVLLVSSSEQSTHVSAVCALASILQGELSAPVHMALWAQSSQRQNGTGTGVADLGPFPWLYGQWEGVRKAQGKVLIIWSPEATKMYEKWREERTVVDNNERKTEDNSKAELKHEKMKVDVDHKLNGKLGKCKKTNKKKASVKQDCVKLCDDKDWYAEMAPSAVTEPVFAAALACLEGALQQSKGQGVAIVYFQGLGHSRDIPNALRGVPRYCLPQDFRGLILELGGIRQQIKTGKLRWHCWPRLLSKVLSIWLAQKLANRLQTLLPQTKGKKMQGLTTTSSQKIISDKTQSRLKSAFVSRHREARNLNLEVDVSDQGQTFVLLET